MIRDITLNDAEACTQLYNYYILNTVVTFEEEVITAMDMQNRIKETIDSLPWIVFEENNTILGYAHASKWKGRCAYRFTAETTVYLDEKARGRGIGSQLYSELINRLKALNYHTAIGGIALPNDASVALHEKMGFIKVAQFRETGRKMGRWIDVGYWQVILSQ
jgi:phosphinothricin acetyltransferase